MPARLRPCLGPAVLLAAAALFVATGLFGVGRADSRPFADVDQFVVAGTLWWHGLDPYDFAVWKPSFERLVGSDPQVPHGYPPQSVVPSLVAAGLGVGGTRLLAAVLSLAAAAALATVTVRWVRDAEEPRPASTHPATPWILAALVVGNPFSCHLAWLGQPTLPIAALVAWGWFLARRRHEALAGVLLGLATFKPHLVALPLLWLALERRWRLLVVTGAVSLAMAVPTLLFVPAGPTAVGWIEALGRVPTHHGSRPGSPTVVGLPSLLAATVSTVPGPFVWLVVALAAVAILFAVRRRLCPDDLLGLLTGTTCTFVQSHTNDLVLLAPLAAAVWLHVAHRRALWLPAGATLALLCLPQRLVRLAGWPLLEHWRTPLVLVAVVSLLVLSVRHPRAEGAPAG